MLKISRSGYCTWPRGLPVRSKKTPSQWSVPCEMRQDLLKNLSTFIYCGLQELKSSSVQFIVTGGGKSELLF